MRTLYDSVTASDIPATAQMVGGYVDGIYAWTAADWGRFPHATHVRIAVHASTNDGHVGDREQGDMTEAELVSWVRMRRAAGVDPTGYCSQSNWSACRAAFAAAGEPEPHWWVAAYPGAGPVIPVGAIAHQYADPIQSGGHFDLSVVADYWPGVDPAPTAQGDVMPLTDIINVTNGPDSLGTTTVGEALGRIVYELTARLPTRATINADSKNVDTLLGRAISADGNSWDNGQRIIALTSKVDSLTGQVAGLISAVAAATTDPAITPAFVEKTIQDAVVQHLEVTGTFDVHPAPAPAPAAPTV